MANAWNSPGEPGAMRYLCPLCDEWWHDEPETPPAFRDPLYRLGLLTAQDAVSLERLARQDAVDEVIREHCATHPLEQWVAATARLSILRGAITTLAGLTAPNPERLADLVLEGSLTAHEARWFRLALGAIEALATAAAHTGAPVIPATKEADGE